MMYNTKDEIYRIVGAAMEVYNELGRGFLEDVYQEALERELKRRNIPFVSQQKINVYYKGEPLDKYYIADLVCYGDVIVELKAVVEVTDVHIAQVVNYMKATHTKKAVLINFGEEELYFRRVFNDM